MAEQFDAAEKHGEVILQNPKVEKLSSFNLTLTWPIYEAALADRPIY